MDERPVRSEPIEKRLVVAVISDSKNVHKGFVFCLLFLKINNIVDIVNSSAS